MRASNGCKSDISHSYLMAALTMRKTRRGWRWTASWVWNRPLCTCSNVATRASPSSGCQMSYWSRVTGSMDTNLPLTTIQQPIYDIGAELVDMLVQHLAGKPVQSRCLEPKLIVRQTS